MRHRHSVCGIAINSSHDHELTLAGVVFDTLVLGLTMIKTYNHAKEMQRLGQLSVTQVLLRDGECCPGSIPLRH